MPEADRLHGCARHFDGWLRLLGGQYRPRTPVLRLAKAPQYPKYLNRTHSQSPLYLVGAVLLANRYKDGWLHGNLCQMPSLDP